jgi:hypothetical protein
MTKTYFLTVDCDKTDDRYYTCSSGGTYIQYGGVGDLVPIPKHVFDAQVSIIRDYIDRICRMYEDADFDY